MFCNSQINFSWSYNYIIIAPDWNGLPESVVLETSINRFKSVLSKVNNEKKLFYVFD